MLKLKLQYFGHLMWRADWLAKSLMLGKIEGRRRRGWQRMRWLDVITLNGHESEQTPGDNEEQGSLACCSPKSWTRLSNWTIASSDSFLFSYFLVPCKNYHSVHLLLPLVQLTFSLLIFWTVYVKLFIFISLVVQISFVWFEQITPSSFCLNFFFFNFILFLNFT